MMSVSEWGLKLLVGGFYYYYYFFFGKLVSLQGHSERPLDEFCVFEGAGTRLPE